MKYSRILWAVVMAFLFCSAFTLKGKEKAVYAFGVAASFNDTLVYYTEIQLLDSVKLDKSGFLPRREAYSNQLRDHLEYTMSKPNYTCMIYFSEDKSKLQKEATKVLSKYRHGMVLEVIKPETFTFKKPEE